MLRGPQTLDRLGVEEPLGPAAFVDAASALRGTEAWAAAAADAGVLPSRLAALLEAGARSDDAERKKALAATDAVFESQLRQPVCRFANRPVSLRAGGTATQLVWLPAPEERALGGSASEAVAVSDMVGLVERNAQLFAQAWGALWIAHMEVRARGCLDAAHHLAAGQPCAGPTCSLRGGAGNLL
jgi:hypothetical protein